MRFAIAISYLGTHYAGWQAQPSVITVQSELDKALSTVLRENIQTLGAGRTDAGVHASELIVHFDCEKALPTNFLKRINGVLPADISVNRLYIPKNPAFHARFDAIARGYEYFITAEKNPYLKGMTWYHWGKLDIEKMNQAAALLLQYDDFASFAKTGADNKTTFCKIYKAEFSYTQMPPFSTAPLLKFHIRADRFLRGMVRATVGTLIEVGEGRCSIADFQKIIEAKDRKKAGSNAPSDGLFLVEVSYPEGTFEENE